MGRAYSYDLREKALGAWDRGLSLKEVGDRFGIGKITVYRWDRLRRERGDFRSLKPGSVGYGNKITDWDAFAAFAKEHAGKTLKEMAEIWGSPISRMTLCRGLARIGMTRKKNVRV
jgi:transposase